MLVLTNIIYYETIYITDVNSYLLFIKLNLSRDKRGNILQNDEDIDLSLGKMISNDDYLMIKGSNSTGLNKFTNNLKMGKMNAL